MKRAGAGTCRLLVPLATVPLLDAGYADSRASRNMTRRRLSLSQHQLRQVPLCASVAAAAAAAAAADQVTTIIAGAQLVDAPVSK